MAEILIIDDQDRYMELCRRAIPQHRYLGPARNWAEAADWLKRRGRIDVVLLDVHFDIPSDKLLGWTAGLGPSELEALKRTQGLKILGEMRRQFADVPVVLMTSRAELHLEEQAEALNAEEYTYFLDEDYVDARSLAGQIDGIVNARKGRESEGPIFWGRAIAMRRLRQRLEVLARGRLPVVLLGPTGTGKSLLARHFVHARSARSGRFVSVDLATLPNDLMAAHLFGSVKGAYTGSIGDRPGAFETANRGTIFLDEVGNLSPDAQKMLLSVLQEGTVTRLGDLRERSVDVKLVVATNEDLAERVREGAFRADLYMRLNPATAVRLPSLSERRLDLEPLLGFSLERALERPYLREMLEEYRQNQGLEGNVTRTVCRGPVPAVESGTIVLLFPERSIRLLRAHDWPGNLREFAMVAENAVLFALAEMAGVKGGERADVIQVRPKLIRDLLQRALPGPDASAVDGTRLPIQIEARDTLNKVAQHCERQYFTMLYLKEGGDFGAMAQLLLGDPEHARKVQLRFNQLGLKVRDLKARLR
jgi:DNA-binding NtrC family response regulator